MAVVTPGFAEELARIRRAADPPSLRVRWCAWSGCGIPLVIRPGERAGDFAERDTCTVEHGQKHRGELSKGRAYHNPRTRT